MSKTHFARLLDQAGVDRCLAMLAEAAGVNSFKELDHDIDDEGNVRVRAPDNDEVFAALSKGDGTFICRLHREVFAE